MKIKNKHIILQHFPDAITIYCARTNEIKLFLNHIHIATFDASWWDRVYICMEEVKENEF